MKDSMKMRPDRLHFKRYTRILAVVWTVVVVGSLLWNIVQIRENRLEAARIEARSAYDKDLTYRHWNSIHGGVYVPVTEKTQPNPYLDVAEREITTPSGRLLTLVNPAYMTRQVHELAEEKHGIYGHITSLNPIRPENAADPWETQALQAFERGEMEVTSLEDLEDEEYMRLMRPLVTEESCLQCHAAQGYQVGDIRGGISVSVPMAPLLATMNRGILVLTTGHTFLWLMGLAGIVLGTRRLTRIEWERTQAEEELRKAHDELESRVEERTVELTRTNEELQIEITQRKQVEERLGTSHEQLRSLSAHLESVREDERKNMAREIHDELGQTLTAMKIDLSWLSKRFTKEQELLLEKTKSMYTLVDIAIQTVKRVSAELRPGVLDDLGITAALEWQALEFEKLTEIKCEFSSSSKDITLDPERSTAIFRIFQETLTNVVRHSNATRVQASLKEEAGKIILSIVDNGKGIRKKQISDPKAFGLIGMRERAHFWGGEVKITGAPGKGTTVVVSIPLINEENLDAENTSC